VAVFIFDCSSAHEAFASDALMAHKMNRGPGGKVPKMRDTIIPTTGQPQSMVFPLDSQEKDKDGNLLAGKPKGMERVLAERGLLDALKAEHGSRLAGVCRVCKLSQEKRDKLLKEMKARQDEIFGSGILGREAQDLEELDKDDDLRSSTCCMQRVLSLQNDFKSEKPLLQLIVERAGHKCFFLPKFHCELNPIEMVWGRMKYRKHLFLLMFSFGLLTPASVFRERTDGTFSKAKQLVPQCLDMVTVDQIRRFFRHCWRYMDAYRYAIEYSDLPCSLKHHSDLIPISDMA
jgi:hypothetical protein